MFLWHKYALTPLFQSKIALRNSQGEVFTWQQLCSLINRQSLLFQQQGVKAGSGVLLCGKNDFSLLLAYLATIQLGARVLGVNPSFPADKIQHIAECYQCDFIFNRTAFLFKNMQNLTALSVSDCTQYVDVLPETEVKMDLQAVATLTLTSGSSGLPKAVVHSLQGHLDNAIGVCELTQFSAKNSWLLSLPLFHVSGQGIIWRWLVSGAELHLPQEDFYFSVSQASHCSLVPTQLQRLFDYWQQNPTLPRYTQHILLGGTQIPTQLTEKLAQYSIKSYTGYGMTEMASTVCAKLSDGKRGVGLPLAGREVRLVCDEIWVRGAGLALGYWQQGKICSLLNEQGWFATKDKGIWQDNELHILGRLDNMFISGGENIQPEEIEQIIGQNETVAQVFVLPIDDVEFGQRPVAMIKFHDVFSEQAVHELHIWLADKLEKFKQPIQYFPLLLQSQGNIKISRHQLKSELTRLLGK
ncbi:o-succinylbenzoate--CoA ligase [Histophilus somni]|uniref:o-succinylbenzoate--CoA ligase n=1 Tax=Histophilus somni TaxID=731 RepID=UPI000039724F|nr:o-succinylbenzoate--CoA ligase [Histophilus somni]ACA31992.1 O-succinylbenzoate-CoA ligase [Histophilus somni 2336]QQF85592.1 o-succinylbenzoate--CoA ligase [Histophilus somni]QQJ90602.1 o-succinylbenzoate--CoA ligase [Histophilus somni]